MYICIRFTLSGIVAHRSAHTHCALGSSVLLLPSVLCTHLVACSEGQLKGEGDWETGSEDAGDCAEEIGAGAGSASLTCDFQ